MKIFALGVVLAFFSCHNHQHDQRDSFQNFVIFFELWPEEPLLRLKPQNLNKEARKDQILEIRKHDRQRFFAEWKKDGTIRGINTKSPFHWEEIMDQKCPSMIDILISHKGRLAGIIVLNFECKVIFRNENFLRTLEGVPL